MTTPAIFTRIPYEVEAAALDADNLEEMARWTGGKIVRTTNSPAFLLFPNVDEPRGVIEAQIGDMIVKGENGRFTKVASSVFFTEFEAKIVEVQ